MCKICDHPKRKKIDAAIVRRTKYSTIFHQIIKSGNEEAWIQAMKDHKRHGHVTEKIQKAQEAEDIQSGLELQACAQEIYVLCLNAAKDARQKDLRAFGGCISPAVKVLEFLKGPEQPDTSQESPLLSTLKTDVKRTFKDDLPMGTAKPQAAKNP